MGFLKSFSVFITLIFVVGIVSAASNNITVTQAAIQLLLFDEGEVNISGAWRVFIIENGEADEIGQLIFSQNDTNLHACYGDRYTLGSVVNNSLSIVIDEGTFFTDELNFVGQVLSDELIQGTISVEGSDIEFRMDKISNNGDCFEPPYWDYASLGAPKIVSQAHIGLENITRISKFRSSAGHDYSDNFETCRSMKHYYELSVEWHEAPFFAPISGTITQIIDEGSGYQIFIRVLDYPAFVFSVFHMLLPDHIAVGETVSAGQFIGFQFPPHGESDIAVTINGEETKLISHFEMMTPSLLQEYAGRGLNSIDEVIVSKEMRDNDPLSCDGETFTSSGTLESYKELN